ncbi:hypothetical protein [Fulvivirga ligni]|uniref:hypothetical protein n=1 Tax=Fulvivirga ligni TaxID=2904246 RepID=UPI001F3C948A|nr:hypothetical protein [Fulvivirga ligni]UII21883.1 hypothetical protein LVD16_01370 [Fulvivirga ligni]
MHRLKSGILFTAIICVFSSVAWGQASKSPITSKGIGDVYNMGLIHNKGMADIGISNGSYWYLNNLNPALLPYNSLTIFTAGMAGEQRTVSNGIASETNSGGNLEFLVLALPMKPGKWTSSIGLMPYSNVDYEFSYSGTVAGNDTLNATITERGSGGYNQVFFSNGVAINKSFSVGLRAAYIFSSIEKESLASIDNIGPGVSFTPNFLNRVSVSDFMFGAGVAYRKDSIFNNRIRLNIGLTYDFKGDLNAKKYVAREQTVSGVPVTSDTLDSQRGSIVIPHSFGAGISFTNGYKWTVGADVKMQQWSDYKSFEGGNDNLANSFKVGLGGEYTPDYSSVNSYLKRVTYRLGVSYEDTPYVIGQDLTNGKQLKDFGINFGWSLPVGRLSSLDFAFKVGKRGSVSDNSIEEDYYQVHLGFNFNDQWFVKRKYD